MRIGYARVSAGDRTLASAHVVRARHLTDGGESPHIVISLAPWWPRDPLVRMEKVPGYARQSTSERVGSYYVHADAASPTQIR